MDAFPPRARTDFPRLSFVCTVVLTLVTIGVLGRSSLHSLSTLRGLEQEEIAIERACGRIALLDETLSMSARMAATTGDPYWERRYCDHAPRLAAALEEVRLLAPMTTHLAGGEQTWAAAARSEELERRALESVRSGELAEAAALLASEEYQRVRRLATASNDLFLSSLRGRVSSILEGERLRAVWEQGILMALVPALLVSWFHVGRAIVRHVHRRREDEARERERARELQEKNAEVEEALRVKSEFLSRMSHEIRTPMNGVLGLAEVLSHTDLDEEQARYVQTILGSGDLLQSIVGDILDYSKIEAGRVEIVPEPCDPRVVVDEVVGILSQRAERKGVALEARIEGGVPERVSLDPVRVRQVLLNLVGNAVKFTEEGRVELALEPGPRPGTLAFRVEDTGPGIAHERLERIFESFTQADASVERRFGGTGLGLTISRELSRRMGGEIEVESELGAGTVFTVVLPSSLVTPEDAAADGSAAPPTWNARVLVAEDNAVNQLVSRRMLERHGLAVELVENGREAVEAWERGDFDLVFMDLGMPVLGGLEAARAIREREEPGRHTPIVALTASAYPGDLEACGEAAMDGFVGKPIREQELAATLEHCLGAPAPPPAEPADGAAA